MIKIATMDGVREYAEGYQVELLWDEERKRYVIYAQNQGGNDGVLIDFADLISFLKSGPWTTSLEDGTLVLHGRDAE
jgi:hypothetical protein